MVVNHSCSCELTPGKNGRSKHVNTNYRCTNCSIENLQDNKRGAHGVKITDNDRFEGAPLWSTPATLVGYIILYVIGHVRDFFLRIGQKFNLLPTVEKNREGYAPLYSDHDSFYTRNCYRFVSDCWNRPICSIPGVEIVVKERSTQDNGLTFEFTGQKLKCLNFGSYNYLGFAENDGPCAVASQKAVREFGVGIGGPRQELGTLPIHQELERCVARFVGAEDAITFGMGFATNALNLPSLISKGCLVLSDENNHASVILGLRLSGATVRLFKHNDMKSLEEKLREGVLDGQPRTCRPWRKIFIVVEGIYSMEGSIVKLPEIIALKKKYKAYLYLDEAHSIGALGPNGRGAVDYYGCHPKDVDVLMGTFSKSFGAFGGYIAGSRKMINHLRMHSQAACYATAMPPPVAQQIISSMRIIMGEDGTGEGRRRLDQLLKNTRYFRSQLRQLGLIVYGNEDSPVVPVMLLMPAKIIATSRELLKRGIASVVVGYPAVPLTEGRARFCISASHTKEMLDKTIEAMAEVSQLLHLNYSRLPSRVSSVGHIDYGDQSQQRNLSKPDDDDDDETESARGLI